MNKLVSGEKGEGSSYLTDYLCDPLRTAVVELPVLVSSAGVSGEKPHESRPTVTHLREDYGGVVGNMEELCYLDKETGRGGERERENKGKGRERERQLQG